MLKNKNKLIILMLLLSVGLVGCSSKDKVKNPYDKKDAEIGTISETEAPEEEGRFELTSVSDPFVRDFINGLTKDYKVLKYDETKVVEDSSEYSEDMIFEIKLEGEDTLKLYRVPKDSEAEKRMRTHGQLIPKVGIGNKREAYIYNNYALLSEGVKKEIFDIYIKTGKDKKDK